MRNSFQLRAVSIAISLGFFCCLSLSIQASPASESFDAVDANYLTQLLTDIVGDAAYFQAKVTPIYNPNQVQIETQTYTPKQLPFVAQKRKDTVPFYLPGLAINPEDRSSVSTQYSGFPSMVAQGQGAATPMAGENTALYFNQQTRTVQPVLNELQRLEISVILDRHAVSVLQIDIAQLSELIRALYTLDEKRGDVLSISQDQLTSRMLHLPLLKKQLSFWVAETEYAPALIYAVLFLAAWLIVGGLGFVGYSAIRKGVFNYQRQQLLALTQEESKLQAQKSALFQERKSLLYTYLQDNPNEAALHLNQLLETSPEKLSTVAQLFTWLESEKSKASVQIFTHLSPKTRRDVLEKMTANRVLAIEKLMELVGFFYDLFLSKELVYAGNQRVMSLKTELHHFVEAYVEPMDEHHFLADYGLETLFDFMLDQPSNVMVFILSHIDGKRSSALLAKFEPELAKTLIQGMLQVQDLDLSLVSSYQLAIMAELEASVLLKKQNDVPVLRVTNVLEQLPKSVREQILGEITEEEQSSIRAFYIDEQDVLALEELALSKVISQLENPLILADLWPALSREHQEKVLSVVTDRLRTQLKTVIEDEEHQVSDTEIETARQAFVRAARKAEKSGVVSTLSILKAKKGAIGATFDAEG